jgi:hypothetical protein
VSFVDQAVRRYPELAGLARLARSGWVFHGYRDENGEPGGIIGTHHWISYADLLWIIDRDDALALRLVSGPEGPTEDVVWEFHGTLSEALTALSALPAPGQPGAPSQVIRTGVHDCLVG